MSKEEMISKRSDLASELTAFQQNILTILAEEARYGLAIKRELEEYYDSEVNHGRLYPNLDDLVALDLVEKSQRDKRTNEYALTDAGYEVLLAQFKWMFDRVLTEEGRVDDIEALIADVQ